MGFGAKFDTKMAQGKTDWRKLYNGEFYDLCYTENNTRLMKYMRLRWAGHVARTEQWRSAGSNVVALL